MGEKKGREREADRGHEDLSRGVGDRPKLGKFDGVHPATGARVVVDPTRDVHIDVGRIHEEIATLPGKLAWYTQLRDLAADNVGRAEMEEAKLTEDAYRALKESTQENETGLRNMVKVDPQVRKAARRRFDLEREHARAATAVKALEEKRSCLQMLVKLKSAEIMTGKELD